MRRLLRSCSWLGTVTLVVCSHTAVLAESSVFFDGDLGAIVGGSVDGKWVAADKIVQQLKGGETWTFYTGDKTSTGKGSAPKPMDTPFEYAFELDFSPKPKAEDFLATTGVSKGVLAPARSGSTTIPAYVDAVRDYLKAAGIKDPEVKITQLIKVDLDADGEDEAIVIATRYKRATEHGPSANADAGDYSVALLRKVIDGKVKTIPLIEEVYPKKETFCAPNDYRFAGALDLNGDGVMEVIIRSRYYEGAGTMVFEIKKGKAKDVISEGIGV